MKIKKVNSWILRIILLGSVFGLSSSFLNASTEIKNVRIGVTAQKTRLVFDASSPVLYRLTSVSSPYKWKLEFLESEVLIDFSKISLLNTPLQHIQLGRRQIKTDKENAVYLTLNQNTRIKHFTLAPQASYGHRLVLDFYPIVKEDSFNPFVIAIDAGHGGVDPGAVGKRGTLEKTITLSIARHLKAVLDKEPGLVPLLIRDADYFLTLRQRLARARKAKADLFISIHADSGYNPGSRGSSVYVLSERGASSEAARWLAHRENQADLLGGRESISLKNRDKMLASVLLDLSMTAKIDASLDAAKTILESLAVVNPLHKSEVEYAGFVVLKSPDIPSVLVETAFISNWEEEKKLKNKPYQRELARAIADGIKQYVMKQGTANQLAKNEF